MFSFLLGLMIFLVHAFRKRVGRLAPSPDEDMKPSFSSYIYFIFKNIFIFNTLLNFSLIFLLLILKVILCYLSFIL